MVESIKEVRLPTASLPHRCKGPTDMWEGKLQTAGTTAVRAAQSKRGHWGNKWNVMKHNGWKAPANLSSGSFSISYNCRSCTFYVSGEQKRRRICGTLQWLDVRLFILRQKSKFSSGFGRSYSDVPVRLWCKAQCFITSDCSLERFPIRSHSHPLHFPPFLNLAKRESNSCRQALLCLCFIFNIIEMNLKAMCALRLGFQDAFPHYPLQNGTCCRTPRRLAALRAARGKQCGDADGFSKRLFRTHFIALIARKSPSRFYLRMRRAFPNCATFLWR